MSSIPRDPAMLLSYINTQLRDYYPSMDELCAGLSLDRKMLDEILEKIDYKYDSNRNQYV